MKAQYPIAEHTHSIHGVPGRMFAVRAPQKVRDNMVHRNQTWISEARPVDGYGTDGAMHVKIRFDDGCMNGHQSFSITADVYTKESRRQRDIAVGGCMHDEIKRVFPELAPLVKWHLMSTDGPMHYIANTVFQASNRDHYGRAAGEASAWDTVIYFGTSPVSHKISEKFARFIQDHTGTGNFQVVAIAHDNKPGEYHFAPNYTFAGYGEKWHECPFDNETVAQEWAEALNSIIYRIDRIVTATSEGKQRNLDAARSCAIWPEATDEELTQERVTLENILARRLPVLIAEFRADMERIGFLWEPVE